MIEITFDPNNFELKIEGHAGQAEHGKDIVCSAVSILFYTLAETLSQSAIMLEEHPNINIDDGNGYIRCVPKDEYKGNIARTYWTVLVGLELLTGQYPEYITFKVNE